MAGKTKSGDQQSAGEQTSPQFQEIIDERRSGYKTLGETVLDILRQSILRGVFEPGERLRQEELAERMGVSRIPVRTALMKLDAEGLVVFHPHRGAIVRSLDMDRLREIYGLRILLEPYALQAAAKLLTAEEKDELVTEAILIDQSEEGAQFYTERVDFYRRLYAGDRNTTTVQVIEQLRLSIGRYRLGLWMQQHGGFSHEALARAVQEGRIGDAQDMLRAHLQSVCDQLSESLMAAQGAAV